MLLPVIFAHVGFGSQHSAFVHAPIAQVTDSGISIKCVPSAQPSKELHVGFGSQQSAATHTPPVAHVSPTNVSFK